MRGVVGVWVWGGWATAACCRQRCCPPSLPCPARVDSRCHPSATPETPQYSSHPNLHNHHAPHPCPALPPWWQVRDFHAVIGKETRAQALEKWGGKPDILVACVGGGSNAMGLFHEFVDDQDVRLIGVEAGEEGVVGCC